MVNVLTDSSRTDEGSFNSSVADNFCCESTHEGLPLVSGFPEPGEFFSVTHHRKVGCPAGSVCDLALGNDSRSIEGGHTGGGEG
mmetsp:Transcript_31965/g.63318  ORF Transcript_31965/g.63318 Transcript_31965/m.63318 type:complete len:84 (+) Transcript_31965:376-627(+)